MTDRPNRFHLSLNVERDRFEPMVAFYSALFGAPPVKRKPDYAKFEPAEPYVNFTFNAVDSSPSGEIDHLGIQVFSDETLGAARARITEAGMPVRDEQETDCCYATQNKFWVTDPTGRQVEFFHVLRDVESKRTPLRTVTAGSSACCAPPAPESKACCTPAAKDPQAPGSGCC